MIIVMGALQVREADLGRLRPALIRQVETTRHEDGCEHYALAHDILDPTVLQVGERWRDQAAMGMHLVSDQMVRFNVDLRAARILSARVDSYHPGGEVRKLIDVNAPNARFSKENKAMVIVMGTVKFAPGEIDRFNDAIVAQIEATRAEDGCEHYAFARDVIDPDIVHVSERWRDNAALTAHFASAHMAAFNAVLASAAKLELSVKAYEGDTVRTLMGS